MKIIKTIIFIMGIIFVQNTQCMETSCRAIQIRRPLHFTPNRFVHEVQKIMRRDTTLNNSEHAALLISYMNKNNVEIVEFLIKNPPINPTSIPIFFHNGKSVLHHAVKEKNPYFVSLLLSNNQVDPNIQDECGFTPLFWAIDEQAVDCIKLLVDCSKTNINSSGDSFATPFLDAIWTDNTAIIDLFINDPKTNFNDQDIDGITPLMRAAGRKNSDCVRKLLGKPHSVINKKDKKGNTALSYSLMTFDDNSECIKLLQTEPNFDLNNFNIRNKDGVTPFEIATIMNQIQHIELLLAQKGTDIINVQNERGLNSLFLR